MSFDPQFAVLASPPGILSTLGNSTSMLRVDNIPDNLTFISTIRQTFLNQSIGGVSLDTGSGQSLFAWEATPPGMTGLVMLNLASNVVFNHALNTSNQVGPRLIMANFEQLPGISGEVLNGLKWLAFYGAAIAVYPAFFSLYVSKERRSSVQAMQLSNGLADPAGLWLGHLMFDSIFGVIAATIIIIIFAAVSNQFHGLGLFWLVLVFYGIASALFSYCVSLVVSSPLAAFAASAGYQVVMFVLYTADYLLILTYAKSTMADHEMTVTHYALSVASPVASALRAAFVSVNLFSLLCDNGRIATPAELGTISKFGGPILYLIIYSFILFGILVWADSGSVLPRRKTWLHRAARARTIEHNTTSGSSTPSEDDVEKEAVAVSDSDDILRVLDVSKAFGGPSNKVVDDVSFGVNRNTIFALLGPNGAGKTTTFNIIRGEIIPDQGDVLINETSVVHHPRSARLSLGVCPQFTAVDSQLTVREHLIIYGRLKGLYRGEELMSNVENLMRATSLHQYADRLASKLSGGNQRKLSLAIALIGNPSCILIDEFSTGIDAKMKREMWNTLRNVAVGKAIIITTHSMEEASALATKVGILAKRMLAVGSIDQLASRYATYEVHFSCRTSEEVVHAQELMASIPGARMAEDVATRFEVPIGEDLTLSNLFSQLSANAGPAEYAVERATLESIFLKHRATIAYIIFVFLHDIYIHMMGTCKRRQDIIEIKGCAFGCCDDLYYYTTVRRSVQTLEQVNVFSWIYEGYAHTRTARNNQVGFADTSTPDRSQKLVDEIDLYAARYTQVTPLVMLLYHHSLTLSDEIDLFWNRRWSIAQLLFFLIRYPPIGWEIFLVIAYFDKHDSARLCVQIFGNNFLLLNHATVRYGDTKSWLRQVVLCLKDHLQIHSQMFHQGITVIYTIHAILILRLYGLYGSKKLMYALSTLLALAFGAELYVAVSFSPTFIAVDLGSPIGNVCVTENTSKMSFVWIPILTFEIIVFLLALYKGIEQFRNGAIQASGLMQVMIRDSFAYFLIIVAVDIANLIAWIHVRPTLRSVTFTFTGTLMSILGSLMLMNIRLEARSQAKGLDTIEMLSAHTHSDSGIAFRRPAESSGVSSLE
ncbi:hypothetical protein NM688_g7082 [Phlebia brevispora]|uniref:Uncharacterized protein n=1 Tax=Phlebia brevispora TaxID=194682 RepID=A0ACC1S975_9APHY|nr:hypothetical protein NM688_g7082 [Phlebia brevispora]